MCILSLLVVLFVLTIVVGAATAIEQGDIQYGPTQTAPDQLEFSVTDNWSHLSATDVTVYDYADRPIPVEDVTTDNAGHTVVLDLDEELIGGDAHLAIQGENHSIETASKFVDLSVDDQTLDAFAGEQIVLTNLADGGVITITHPGGERERGAGQNSTVRVIDTNEWEAGDEVTVTSRDNEHQLTINLHSFEFSGSTDREMYSTGEMVEVAGNADRVQREIIATIRNDRGDIVEQVETVTDASGEFSVSHTADEQGIYSVIAADKETWISNELAEFVVGPTADNLTFVADIPNDGKTYAVGIPGRLNGTLDHGIDGDASGFTLFVLENGEWRTITELDETEFSGLEALVVTSENTSAGDENLPIHMEFTETPDTATPPLRELDRGWHLVSAPMYHAAETVFDIQDAFVLLDPFEHATSPHYHQVDTFDSHFIGQDENTVSPFNGYYLYVEDETALPGVLSTIETRNDIIAQLGIEPLDAQQADSQHADEAFTHSGAVQTSHDDLESPPVVPASYYGEVSINGEPIPEGAQIEARIDGDVRGKTTVSESGKFGGPTLDDEKLTVDLSPTESTATVEWRISGEYVDAITVNETISVESGDIRDLHLTATTDGPHISDYTTEDAVVATEDLRSGVSDWRSGKIDTELLRDIVSVWRSGNSIWGVSP